MVQSSTSSSATSLFIAVQALVPSSLCCCCHPLVTFLSASLPKFAFFLLSPPFVVFKKLPANGNVWVLLDQTTYNFVPQNQTDPSKEQPIVRGSRGGGYILWWLCRDHKTHLKVGGQLRKRPNLGLPNIEDGDTERCPPICYLRLK